MGKIDEKFLQQAIDIRRRYLKINNNILLYQKELKNIESKLEKHLTDLNDILDNINDKNSANKADITENANKTLKILNELDENYKTIKNNVIDPNNKEIEALLKEEGVYYEKLKNTYPNLSDELIYNEVWDRLTEEGLL